MVEVPVQCFLCYWHRQCNVSYVTGTDSATCLMLLTQTVQCVLCYWHRQCNVSYVTATDSAMCLMLLAQTVQCVLCYWHRQCNIRTALTNVTFIGGHNRMTAAVQRI
jgi:hypothetical protein